LYKRVQLDIRVEDSIDILTNDVFPPTSKEVESVEAEVGDEALTRAIIAVKLSTRSTRIRVDSVKVKENKALEK
jgi:hypothetical protein